VPDSLQPPAIGSFIPAALISYILYHPSVAIGGTENHVLFRMLSKEQIIVWSPRLPPSSTIQIYVHVLIIAWESAEFA
jgi:hypothetical protein